MSSRSLQTFFGACHRLWVLPTRSVLVVSVASQTVSLFEKWFRPTAGHRFVLPHPDPLPWGEGATVPARQAIPNHWKFYELIRTFRCSTSRFGVGQAAGSNGTPLGLHRLAEKIGGGWPVGTVFKSRRPVGFTWQGLPDAKITTRILWLDGLEPGLNRGGAVDSHARCIYLHGTGDELTIGRPASCGCIHLAADDIIPLFDKLPNGTLVWIAER